MNREDLRALRERLAVERAELVEDIERRQVELDCTPGYVLAERRRAERGREVIFKVRDNAATVPGGMNGASGDVSSTAIFSDDQLDVIAQAMADQKNDIAVMVDNMLAPLRDRILALEARVETVLALLGAGKSIAGPGRKRLPPPKDAT